MFSEALSVILSTGKGGLPPGEDLPTGVSANGGSASRGICLQRGICPKKVSASGGGVCLQAATAAVGTHPTGMHSCLKCENMYYLICSL